MLMSLRCIVSIYGKYVQLRTCEVPYTRDGPFWALGDGNDMLASHGSRLVPASTRSDPDDGKYVLYRRGHFESLEIIDGDAFLHTSHRTEHRH